MGPPYTYTEIRNRDLWPAEYRERADEIQSVWRCDQCTQIIPVPFSSDTDAVLSRHGTLEGGWDDLDPATKEKLIEMAMKQNVPVMELLNYIVKTEVEVIREMQDVDPEYMERRISEYKRKRGLE